MAFSSRPRLVATALAAALLAGTLGALPASAGAHAAAPVTAPRILTQVDAPVPTLDWTRCQDIPRSLCATAVVPLDYDDPTGPTILLDLVKVPALDAGRRLGTLFVNPGGPGGSATEFAFYASELLGDTVALRYDVIGVDPRGVGRHSEMVCTPGTRPDFPQVSFPITEPQSKRVWNFARWERLACRDNPNAIVAHMSTADTARDMDLIRQAVGEDMLDYYGISYGTYLGTTYAAMFPDRVGRMVVDGVLDPVAWSTGDEDPATEPFSTRLRSARGAYESLTTGLAECDRVGRSACAFAGDADAKWRWLVRKAKQGDLRVWGGRFTYQDLVGITLSLLYDNYSYDSLGYTLADIYKAAHKPSGSGKVASARMQRLLRAARDTISAPYGLQAIKIRDPFAGVACADSVNPSGRLAWWEAGRAQDRQYPWFGSLWTWASAPCSGWPAAYGEDAFRGPWEVTTANPLLVVGNSHDPATPVQGARKVTTLFAGSRFLLMDGWGHGAITNTCVTEAFDAYYATGDLPAEGTVCPADRPLFGAFEKARSLPKWRPQAG